LVNTTILIRQVSPVIVWEIVHVMDIAELLLSKHLSFTRSRVTFHMIGCFSSKNVKKQIFLTSAYFLYRSIHYYCA
jgi:hypothetical protein